MSVKYTYNKKVNSEVLASEIRSSEIIIALDCINVSNDTVIDIFFKGQLSQEDGTKLTVLVNEHDYTASLPVPPVNVKILEEERPTGGHFKSQTFSIDIGEDVGWYESIFSFPYRIGLLSSELNITSEHVGNTMCTYVADGMITGAITNDAKAGDTTIYVQKSVIDHTDIGFFITLTDGTNTDELSRVINKTNNSLTLENPLEHDFTAGTPTYVKISVHVFEDLELFAEGRLTLGDSKIGASIIEANVPIKSRYYNNNGGAKRFVWLVDMLY